jgi:hypothetical protein
VLALSWPPAKTTPVINHYPNAFEAAQRLQSFF